MDYVTFGRTGLTVSAVGLGTGGASKLGLRDGGDERHAIDVIHRALELGITYFDTAKGYGTEALLGSGLHGVREGVVISSKAYVTEDDGSYVSAAKMAEAIEDSLRNLKTETIDVYHLHRLTLDEYDYAQAEIYPVLERFRTAGKIRFVGVSESTSRDGEHLALHRAAKDDLFDVMMTGFNFFNQGSPETLFPLTIERDIAIEIMGSARGPFSHPDRLHGEFARLVDLGLVGPEWRDRDDPLGFLVGEGHATSLAEASYRFTRYARGVHVVLVGTGNLTHLEENIGFLHSGPLPVEDLEMLHVQFGHLRVTRA